MGSVQITKPGVADQKPQVDRRSVGINIIQKFFRIAGVVAAVASNVKGYTHVQCRQKHTVSPCAAPTVKTIFVHVYIYETG